MAGGLVVLDEDFIGEEDGPEIVGFGTGIGGVGGVPTVGALAGDDLGEVTIDFGLERLVIQQPGEWDDAIEPVGGALPAFGLAAKPLALAHVRPELVQMPAQTVGLETELALEPAERGDRTEREWAERRFGETVARGGWGCWGRGCGAGVRGGDDEGGGTGGEVGEEGAALDAGRVHRVWAGCG